MQLPDLNLLPPLEALLRTGSVTAAAEELALSPSAMSRTLARLRRVAGDPLLVPSGRGLARTAHAQALYPAVQAGLAAALGALAPAGPADLATVRRDVVVRTNEALALVLGVPLTAALRACAPGVRLRIVPEGDEDPADLRRDVDLDLGAQPELPPDVRCVELVRHSYAAAGRADGVAASRLTVARFAATPHVTVSRRGVVRSVVDERLEELGHRRTVLATVPSAATACLLALDADALALVPTPVAVALARTLPLAVRPIPLELPEVALEMAWHQRHDTDPLHRWLRDRIVRLSRELAHA